MNKEIVQSNEQTPLVGNIISADFSVNDFILSKKAGFEPVCLCVGTSIYQMSPQVAKRQKNVELNLLSQAMYTARNNAIGRMRKEAKLNGADGIVGVKMNIEIIDKDVRVMQFTAIGTGVKYTGDDGKSFLTSSGEPFTSNFSVQDLWSLVKAGYKPVELVMGVCVYHVAQRSKLTILSTLGSNLELEDFTQGLYTANKLAQDRMKKEVEKANASIVLNANVRQGSHDWQSHVVEFFALGTAVAPITGMDEALGNMGDPMMCISLGSK